MTSTAMERLAVRQAEQDKMFEAQGKQVEQLMKKIEVRSFTIRIGSFTIGIQIVSYNNFGLYLITQEQEKIISTHKSIGREKEMLRYPSGVESKGKIFRDIYDTIMDGMKKVRHHFVSR